MNKKTPPDALALACRRPCSFSLRPRRRRYFRQRGFQYRVSHGEPAEYEYLP